MAWLAGCAVIEAVADAQTELNTVNDEVVAVQPLVVTLILPVVPFSGTTALICVLDTTVKPDDAIPLNKMADVPVPLSNPTPVMVTTVFAGPDAGLKEATTGGKHG